MVIVRCPLLGSVILDVALLSQVQLWSVLGVGELYEWQFSFVCMLQYQQTSHAGFTRGKNIGFVTHFPTCHVLIPHPTQFFHSHPMQGGCLHRYAGNAEMFSTRCNAAVMPHVTITNCFPTHVRHNMPTPTHCWGYMQDMQIMFTCFPGDAVPQHANAESSTC